MRDSDDLVKNDNFSPMNHSHTFISKPGIIVLCEIVYVLHIWSWYKNEHVDLFLSV